MNPALTELQKKLCNLLQRPLPVCSKPFAEIAKTLNTNQQEILTQIQTLQNKGIIKRIGAFIDYHALGKIGTLAAAHVRQKILPDVTDAVNAIEGVSHNYLRSHYYNLWFTLLADSQKQVEETLMALSDKFNIVFFNLPAIRVFKLHVYFDAENRNASTDAQIIAPLSQAKYVKLNDNQKLILSKLQKPIEITEKPFDFLAEETAIDDCLKITMQLIDNGVIKRIAAVLNYRKLGFTANTLFVCKAENKRIVEIGRSLAQLPTVSHCYQRQTFENWPYNLFAMMHSRNMTEIQNQINNFTTTHNITSFEQLSTTKELKKQPVMLL